MKEKDNFEDVKLPTEKEIKPVDLPDLENEDNIKITVEQTQKIEIPQEYYEMKAEAERQKAEEEQKKISDKEQIQINSAETGKMLSTAMINAIIYPILLILVQKINSNLIYLLPIYMLVAALISVTKDKKDSNQPIGSLLGGIIVAVISFALSMMQENSDIFFYFTIAGVVVGILGMITANIVVMIMTNRSNVKAVATLGIIIFFAALFGAPYLVQNKFPDIYNKYVLNHPNEIVAETEIEFIEKTLKNRYNITFKCNDGKRINNITQKTPTTVRTCVDPNGVEISVTSITYNQNEVQYAVQDNYMDKIMLDKFRTNIETRLNTITNSNVNIAIYPENGCLFVGDCHDCSEYEKTYSEQNKIENMYEYSTNLNLTKAISMKDTEYLNQNKFKYIIEVSGAYGGLNSSNNESTVEKIIDELNNSGLDNNYGFEVIIKNEGAYNKVVYQVIGEANKNGFKDYKIVDLDANTKNN